MGFYGVEKNEKDRHFALIHPSATWAGVAQRRFAGECQKGSRAASLGEIALNRETLDAQRTERIEAAGGVDRWATNGFIVPRPGVSRCRLVGERWPTDEC